MDICLKINGELKPLQIHTTDTLLDVLRREGLFSVKFGGCQHGECGACAVLLDGRLVNSCSLLAAQADGHSIDTVEAVGEHPGHGWKQTLGLHVIQQAFVDTGAIQCGYCTPAMVLAAKKLLQERPSPTEDEVRDALSGVLCRCTGYLKPVQAILRAAAILRGETPDPIDTVGESTASSEFQIGEPAALVRDERSIQTQVMPQIVASPEGGDRVHVGKPEKKVDAIKLIQGKPAFTNDIEMRGMLVGKILHSTHAHAKIVDIDVTQAMALPGVAAVLTWKDIPRVVYSTAGQSDPIPGPLDSFSLDNKVRFVGDRVALVAAESEEIALHALSMISVTYEDLPIVLDMADAMQAGAPILHDEPEYVRFAESDPGKNLAAAIRIDIGDLAKGFAEADLIVEGDYSIPKVQHVHIEPHVVVTYWDEDDRLVIRSSTQVPFHVRRILSPVLGLPIKRIRVIKPRIGGGFGGKQEILLEDAAAHLTIATGRPVRLEYSREEEFTAGRSRHPMRIHMKTGVKTDGTITANEMYALSDTGANGAHALTVTGNTGHKAMALYVGDGSYRSSPNIRFYADIVYTNTPPAGAFRGYGVPQGFWAVERHMEKIARKLGLDSVAFRLKNALRPGEMHPFSTSWSEGREPKPEIIHTVGLEKCVDLGKTAIGWDQKYGNGSWHKVPGHPELRKGIGMALMMHGTAIPYLDLGSASLKMNDDGSFNLLIGATDLGTGSDTVLAQMAGEVLGVPIDDILVYSSDTDFTPFDKGAYASSTTYISGSAVTKAARLVAERIKARAVDMLGLRDSAGGSENDIRLIDRKAFAPDGRFVTLGEIGRNSLHHVNQEQIMAVASFYSPVSPPPFAAQFAEISVNTITGQITVEQLVMVVDAGMVMNPLTASGQIEGGMAQALGYAVCEEMVYDKNGNARERDLVDYHVFRANEMPKIEGMFVETYEPSHPFGAKAAAEIPLDGVGPAVGNALLDACGVQIDSAPITPEKVWKAMKSGSGNPGG